MVLPSLLRTSIRPNPYICARCAFRASKVSQGTTRRWIGIKYLTKVADAEFAWQEKAIKIQAGKEKSMLTILEERGLVKSITGSRETLDENLTSNRIGAYVGIDPTAPSLHVGHMLPFMSIFWMYLHGYHTVSLIGGATAKIGDPTDRLTTRENTHSSIKTANMVSMHYQMKKLWVNVEEIGKKYGYNWEWSWHRELVNNNAWWNKLPMLEVLQTLGPGMRMGSMLARDTVKNKMSKGDGMSFAEFTYPLMQAWDWWHMFHSKGIVMQIGGADQYGNITAGIEAIKYISKHHANPDTRKIAVNMKDPYGFTVPLLTTSSGVKFGKSAGNAVWLDAEQTSVFDLYGYFLRTPDADVGKYLKMFTFMPIDQIDNLVKEHMESPSQRIAQHALAHEFVELIHGAHEAKQAEVAHRLLFRKPPTPGEQAKEPDADAKAGITTLNNKPSTNIKLPHTLIHTKSIGRILQACGLAETASEGHRLAQNSGAYIGGHPDGKKLPMNDGFVSWTQVKAWRPEDTQKFIVHGDLLMFRKGKHNIRIVQVVSDEEYEASGERYNGMDKNWRGQLGGNVEEAKGGEEKKSKFGGGKENDSVRKIGAEEQRGEKASWGQGFKGVEGVGKGV